MEKEQIQQPFLDSKGYNAHSKQLKESILTQPITKALLPVISHLRHNLKHPSTPPMTKLLSLRFMKECIDTGDYKIIKLVEAELLQPLIEIAKFKLDSQEEDRGKTMFDTLPESEKKPEHPQLGHSILKFNLELMQYLTICFPESPYQYYEFPSMFTIGHKQLQRLGVKFPSTPSYVKPSDLEKLSKTYIELSKKGKKEEMLDGFIEEVSQIILKESRSFTDNIQVVMEVASTGDSNVIQEVIECLYDRFENASVENKIPLLHIMNTLYLWGEVEIINDLRLTFIPSLGVLVSGLKLDKDSITIEHSTSVNEDVLRRLIYETLKMWEHLYAMTQHENQFNLVVYSAFMPEPSEYMFFNASNFEAEFLRNYKQRELLNTAKAKTVAKFNIEEMEQTNNSAKGFGQSIKSQMKYFGSNDFIDSLDISEEIGIRPLPHRPGERVSLLISPKDLVEKPKVSKVDNDNNDVAEKKEVVDTKEAKQNGNQNQKELPKVPTTKSIPDNKTQHKGVVPDSPHQHNRTGVDQHPSHKAPTQNRQPIPKPSGEEPKIEHPKKEESTNHQPQSQKTLGRDLQKPPPQVPEDKNIPFVNSPERNQSHKMKKTETASVDQDSQKVIKEEKKDIPTDRRSQKLPSISEFKDRTDREPSKGTMKTQQHVLRQESSSSHNLPNPKVSAVSRPEVSAHHEEESHISEPHGEPLEMSFHDKEQSEKKILDKIRESEAPSFMMATSSEPYKISTKLGTGMMKGDELKYLKLKISNKNSSLNDNRNGRVEVETVISGIKAEYESRILDLQRKLSAMMEKEKSYLSVIERKESEIESLKDEVSSISNNNSVNNNKNQVQYLLNENSALKTKLNSVGNERFTFSASNSKFSTLPFVPVSFDKPAGQLLVCEVTNLDVRMRKCILRNKEILFKNNILEIGIISFKEDNFVRITIFYTSGRDLLNFKSLLKSGQLAVQFQNKHLQVLQANKQQKQVVNFEITTNLVSNMPSFVVSYDSQSREEICLCLPVSLVKMGVIHSLTKEQSKLFSKSTNIFTTQEIGYSKKIIKDINSLPQYYPEIILTNPEDEQLFYDRKANLMFGFVVQIHASTFPIRVVLCPSHTLYIQGILSNGSNRSLLSLYLGDLLSVFAKEKP